MNALVEILGKQFKVEKGDKIKVPFIDKKIGEKLSFDSILYLEDGKKKQIGKPFLKNLSVEAKLLEHRRDSKVIVFKFKRRKGYQKKNGHRQQFSIIEISNLNKKTTAKKAAETKKETVAKETTAKKTAAKKTVAKKTTTKKKVDK